MTDDEIGKLLVVNKSVNIVFLLYCKFHIINVLHYVLELYYAIHKIVFIISLLNYNCE